MSTNDFLFSGHMGPRTFEESVVLNNNDRQQDQQTRISYDEVPLDEYFSGGGGGVGGNNLMTNAQVYLRFKGFNQQAELEEEYRMKKEGLSLQ